MDSVCYIFALIVMPKGSCCRSKNSTEGTSYLESRDMHYAKLTWTVDEAGRKTRKCLCKFLGKPFWNTVDSTVRYIPTSIIGPQAVTLFFFSLGKEGVWSWERLGPSNLVLCFDPSVFACFCPLLFSGLCLHDHKPQDPPNVEKAYCREQGQHIRQPVGQVILHFTTSGISQNSSLQGEHPVGI